MTFSGIPRYGAYRAPEPCRPQTSMEQINAIAKACIAQIDSDNTAHWQNIRGELRRIEHISEAG